MMPTAAALHWIDAAVEIWLRRSVQLSLVVLLILAARALLRGRLAPGARYALWLLLAFPLIAPLLPLPALPLPTGLRRAARSIAAPPPPPATAQDSAGGWHVEYGPITAFAPATPTSLAPPATAPVNWLRWAAVAWMAGVTVLALRTATMHARAIRAARRCHPMEDERTLSLLQECARVVGIRRLPRLILAPTGTGPALLGVLRPRLLLPEGSESPLSPEEVRFIFLHELVHLKRGDVFGELLLALLQIGQWFNPLIWLAASRCRADREIACDAAVLALTGDARRCEYGRTILRLATEIVADRRPRLAGAAAAVGILENRTPLERRLRMIASTPARRPARWPAVIVGLATFVLVAGTNAEPPKPDTPHAADAINRRTQLQRQQAVDAYVEKTNPVEPKAAAAGESNEPRQVRQEQGNPDGIARADAELAAQLTRLLPEIDFKGVGLGDTIDFLRDVSGANVFVNWKALEAAGIKRDAPVTARLKDVQFSKALQIILDSAAGAGNRLAFSADKSVITISTADDIAGNTTTRVYDIRDLLVNVPDYLPDPPQDIELQSDHPTAATQPESHAAAKAQVERQKRIDEVIKLIQETVEPAAWGKIAQVRELSGQLIVTASKRMHESLVQLVTQLREGRAIQVMVETRFIAVDEGVLDALQPGLRETVAGELHAAKDPVPVIDDKPAAVRATPATAPAPPPARSAASLDATQVDQLLRAVQGSPNSKILSAPRMILFNGQSAYVLVANQRAYVADYAIVKQPNGATKYDPQYGVVKSGIMLWAQATADAERKSVTLTLHPRLTHLAGLDEAPWDRSPPGEKLTIAHPKLLASELSTTMNIPDGTTLLLGGLKAYMGEPGSKELGKDAMPVLLLVKSKLILRREVEQPAFPLLKGGEGKKAAGQ
jgi:beta-lactamase regulating signal transducer with metallopeptidase domain/type II secretory pathway component GspD/PulD (secretin)